MTPRSWLFAPGDSPAKMEKALGSGADAVILDLEDSVAPTRKVEARTLVADFLAGHRGSTVQLWVRINPLNTPWARDDVDAAIALGLTGLVLPKADSAAALAELEHWLGPAQQRAGLPAGKIKVLPLVTETPASLFNLGTYAGSSPRLAAMTWGAEDLSAAIGAITARTPDGAYTPLYDLARSLCLAGAAAAGVPAIETVYPDFRDLDGLAAYAARGRRDGFVGMMAIHPSQVAPINAAFTPAAEEIAEAQAIVDLFEANPGAGTLALNGRMVDQPHLLQSLRLLQRVR